MPIQSADVSSSSEYDFRIVQQFHPTFFRWLRDGGFGYLRHDAVRTASYLHMVRGPSL